MEKSREELLQEMQKSVTQSGNVYLSEVAMPGCKAGQVNPSDINRKD